MEGAHPLGFRRKGDLRHPGKKAASTCGLLAVPPSAPGPATLLRWGRRAPSRRPPGLPGRRRCTAGRCGPPSPERLLARPQIPARLPGNLPNGSYPDPVTSISRPSRKRRLAVISFLVRVPVLSVQITVVQPMVSTAGRRLTMAWRRAMRVVPMASAPVTTAGNDSGTAATARVMPQMSISSQAWPREHPQEGGAHRGRQADERSRPDQRPGELLQGRGLLGDFRPADGRCSRTGSPCRWR